LHFDYNNVLFLVEQGNALGNQVKTKKNHHEHAPIVELDDTGCAEDNK